MCSTRSSAVRSRVAGVRPRREGSRRASGAIVRKNATLSGVTATLPSSVYPSPLDAPSGPVLAVDPLASRQLDGLLRDAAGQDLAKVHREQVDRPTLFPQERHLAPV